jgi:23S rRNA pseudouridine955/2504/2580 synthase/23S rRNA pseudouridine1911/1915/1917 synthase
MAKVKNDIGILYQDADIVVINKPAGVSATADRSGAASILQVLTDQRPELGELRLVHRLDKDTSGVMVIALNREAQTFYSRCFGEHEARKIYLAIARGRPARDKGFISDPIAKNDKVQKVRIDTQHGKTAKTFYQMLLPMGPMCLLAVSPITGRTHQIRVHLSHRGLPLAIDPLYADGGAILLSSFKSNYRPSRKREEETPLIDRLTLHAYQLTIPVGPGKAPMTFIAPLDKKFTATIKMLAKHTSGAANNFEYPDVLKQILNAEPLEIDIPRQKPEPTEDVGDDDGEE